MTLCGTDDWMAPEIILGDAYSVAADVFSFGIVLCEIITRKKVSQELQRSPADAFGLNVEKFKKIVPSDCPTEFSVLAIECCAHSPDDRPTFQVMVRKFKNLLKDLQDKETKAAAAPKAAAAATGGTAAGGESVEKFKAYADNLAAMKAAGKITVVGGASTPAGNSNPAPASAGTGGARPAGGNTAGQNANVKAVTVVGGATKPSGGNVVVQSVVVQQTSGAATQQNKRTATHFGNQALVLDEKQGVVSPSTKPIVIVGGNTGGGNTAASTASSSGGGGFYSYDALRANPPAGCDKNNLEKYLNDDEFKKVFGMTKAEFAKVPAWKQRGRKRELGLF